jgi:hypothetical protein
MQRKEINVFSMSFLDLLSSALAAVIILFIIVPKSDIQTQVADEAITELKTQFIEIDSIIQALSQTMSQEEIAEIIKSTGNMKTTIFKLEDATITLKNRLQETKQQNEELRLRIRDVEKQLRKYMQEEEKRTKNARTSTPSQKTEVASTNPPSSASQSNHSSESEAQSAVNSESTPSQISGKGDFMFGLNPAFAVMLTWEDEKADIDLYLAHEGRFCDGQNRSTSFGKFVKMPKKFVTTPNEAIIQKEIKPGIYEIYAHLYRPKSGTASFNGFVAINPPNGNPKKIDFGPIEISSTAPPYRSGGGVLIGTVELSENDVKFKRAM